MKDICYPFAGKITTGEVFSINSTLSLVRLPIPDNLKYINCYIIRSEQGDFIYDTGMATEPAKAIWQQIIDSQDFHFAGIIVSHHHPDHLGLANWLHQKLQIPVFIDLQECDVVKNIIEDTALTAAPEHFVDFFAQFDITDSQINGYFQLMRGIDLLHSGIPEKVLPIEDCPLLQQGWQLVKGHGHSVSVCCLYHSEQQLFLSSDQVLPEISSIVYTSWTREQINPLKDWLESQQRFKTEVPDSVMVMPSHKHIFYGLHQRLEQIIQLHKKRLLRTRELLQLYSYQQLSKITEELFERELKSLPDMFMASGETLAHIEYCLAEKGQEL